MVISGRHTVNDRSHRRHGRLFNFSSPSGDVKQVSKRSLKERSVYSHNSNTLHKTKLTRFRRFFQNSLQTIDTSTIFNREQYRFLSSIYVSSLTLNLTVNKMQLLPAVCSVIYSRFALFLPVNHIIPVSQKHTS